MRIKHYLIIVPLFTAALFGCSKSDDTVTPDTVSTTDLLVRKWIFDDISIKTNVKSYAIPATSTTLFGDDNTLTFKKDNTFTYMEAGTSNTASGKWTLSNSDKTLTMTDADKVTFTMTVNSISTTKIDLSSINADLIKTNPSLDEMTIGIIAEFLLFSIDKDNGGTVDFSKEPDYKTLQLVAKGKAL